MSTNSTHSVHLPAPSAGANYQAELIGLFGQPVAENPTCVMHEAAFAAAGGGMGGGGVGLNFRYLTMEVSPEGLADAVKGARAMGFRGFNCTIPHKVAVMPLLDEISKDAAMIGAVNTVRREGDKLIGENTDGKGFLRGIKEEAGVDPRDKRVTILGAGGAARAIAVELALAGAGELTIVNRSAERGGMMMRDLIMKTMARAHFVEWKGVHKITRGTDIVVNATSIGLYPDASMPEVSFDAVGGGAGKSMLVCDVIPNPPETGFLKEARAKGFKTLDGLAMLVYQGAIAYKMWTGQAPDEAVMKGALRKAFGL